MSLRRRQPLLAVIAAATNVEGWWGQLNTAPARNLTAVASDAAWLPYPVTAVTYNFAAFSVPQHDGLTATRMLGY